MLKTETVTEFLARGGAVVKHVNDPKDSDCLRCRRINPLFGGFTRCRRCTEAEIGVDRKKCRKCFCVQDKQHFRGFYCKTCYNKRTAEYAKRNPELMRRANRESYARRKQNPVEHEMYLQSKREYYANKTRSKE